MSAKRFLPVLLLLAAVFACVMTAAAQSDLPGKAQPPPAVAREEAAVPLGAFPARTEVEPNNDIGHANDIPHAYWFASHVSGVINPRYDADLFRFYGLRGDALAISVAAERYGSGLDSVVQLLDEDGNVLAENDDPFESDLDSFLTYTLPYEGDYYVRISDFDDQHGAADHWYEMFFWARARTDDFNTTPYDAGSEEPNNTRATAYPVRYGDTLPFARIDYDGDVDYYKFDGKKGDDVRISIETTGLYGTVESQLALYNSAGALLASCGAANWGPGNTNCMLQKVLPKDGVYTVKVSDAHNKGGLIKRYWLQVGFYEWFEPNNTTNTSNGVVLGAQMRGLIAPGDDVDIFEFYGDRYDYITVRIDGLDVTLLDSDGHTVVSDTYFCGYGLSLYLPHEGWYYLVVRNRAYTMPDGDTYGAYTLVADKGVRLYGTTLNSAVGGVVYAKNDIVMAFGTPQRALYFDASDLPLSPNVRDFSVVMEDTSCLFGLGEQPSKIVMSLAAKTTLPGVSGRFTAMPQDIVAFVPDELGPVTGGYWEMLLDGSEIGLTTAAEAIDAVSGPVFRTPTYPTYVFSTTGTATLTPDYPGPFTSQDEDLVLCLLLPGETQCWPYFDGSAAGIPAAGDLAAVWVEPFSQGDAPGPVEDGQDFDLYMSFAATTTVGGVTYRPNDVARCDTNGSYPYLSCNWSRYWVGNNNGLGGKVLDGIDMLKEAN